MEKQNSTLSTTTTTKVKLLCSYGGKIHPRPTDHSLSYLGGDTKILAVDRHVTFPELLSKLNSLTNRTDNNSEISIKYQLPGEDLDALVTLIDDDDVEHMMVEYDRMQKVSDKPARLRMFVFDISAPRKDPGSGNPDYLFGFDKEYQPSVGPLTQCSYSEGVIPAGSNKPPPLDLLQIPGMVEAEKGKIGNSGVPVYRIPVMENGAYHTGYGVQPVYNFVPVNMMVSNDQVNQQQQIF